MIAPNELTVASLNNHLTVNDREIAEIKHNIDVVKREMDELNRKYYDLSTQIKALKFRLLEA